MSFLSPLPPKTKTSPWISSVVCLSMPSGNTGPNVSKKESVKEMPFYVDKIAAFKAFFFHLSYDHPTTHSTAKPTKLKIIKC